MQVHDIPKEPVWENENAHGERPSGDGLHFKQDGDHLLVVEEGAANQACVLSPKGPGGIHAPTKDKGREDPIPLLTTGITLKDQYVVKEQLDGGGFGQIFIAEDTKNNNMVAIKAEAADAKMKFLRMEHHVIKKMQGSGYIAQFLASGCYPTCNYIVMSLLGKNVMELKKATTKDRFSIETAARVGLDMLNGIWDCHKIGYIHRDIKPSNFAIGFKDEKSARRVHILDFGLCRQYLDRQGFIRRPRQKCGFRGTVRYASVNIHRGLDMGRHDDLWSLFYVVVEMMKGHLPWRKITDRDKVKEIKETVSVERITKFLPEEIIEFLEMLKPLSYFGHPPYESIAKTFQSILHKFNVTDSTPLDWELLGSETCLKVMKTHSAHKRDEQLGSGGPAVASQCDRDEAGLREDKTRADEVSQVEFADAVAEAQSCKPDNKEPADKRQSFKEKEQEKETAGNRRIDAGADRRLYATRLEQNVFVSAPLTAMKEHESSVFAPRLASRPQQLDGEDEKKSRIIPVSVTLDATKGPNFRTVVDDFDVQAHVALKRILRISQVPRFSRFKNVVNQALPSDSD